MAVAALKLESGADTMRTASDNGSRPSPLRCVLMDDSRFDRRHLRSVAADSRYDIEFVETANIAETREALQGGAADFMLLDNQVPDGSGIDFAKQLAKDASLNSIPVIVVTGQGGEEIVINALRAGAADYLVKDNLNSEIFDQAVENAMRRSQASAPDQMAIISNLQSENETLRRVSVRNMRLLKGQAMPLMSFAWRMLRGDAIEQDQRATEAKGLARITRNVTGLIDDTVIVSATHRAQETDEPVNLNDVIERIVRDDLGEIENSRAQIRVGDLPVLNARASHMTMLFEELLLTAVRAGRLGKVPRIEIGAGTDPDGNPIIWMKENGLQLDARKQSISEKFSELNSTPDSNVRDELSWSLCQRLVEKNDGQFKISETTGSGTKLMMRFPKSRLA